MSYSRFAAMIATSTLVMFGLMYLNTFALEHVFFSETRGWMALLMGAVMAAIMLGFMWAMYEGRRIKLAILAGSAVVFGLTLWLVRSQVTVDGESYMRAMIPHHSIAVMTSGRADIEDARVRKLADGIIAAQRREIAEMRWLIAELDAGRIAESAYSDPAPVVGTVEDALSTLRLETVYPAPLSREEAAQVIDPKGGCAFAQTKADAPIFWTDAEGSRAVMLLNGTYIALEGGAGAFSAAGAEAEVAALGDAGGLRADTAFMFRLENGPQRGYRGWWRCDG